MISKNLFFRLIGQDMKRRLWSFVLVMLAFVLLLPISLALIIGEYKDLNMLTLSYYCVPEKIINCIGPGNFMMLVMTFISAIICGLNGFFYLLSKKKIDMYHSIPVRRETIFTVNYMNGVLIFAIPYLINLLLCIIMLRTNNIMNKEIIAAMITAVGINLLFYCLFYTIAIVSVMLTGNILVSVFGIFVLLFYGIMLWGLRQGFYEEFLYNLYRKMNEYEYLLYSPVGIYLWVVNNYATHLKYGSMLIQAIVELVLLIGLSVFLYRKRPSEAAGRAIAFSKTKPLIRILLVVPTALYGGIVVRDIVSDHYDLWYLCGMIFTLILSFAVIQAVYHFDIRCTFRQWKQLVAYFILTLLIAGVFRYDIFHFNTYIPEKNEIESMSVSISGLNLNMNYSKYNDVISDPDRKDYELSQMKLTDYSAAYELAKMGIKAVNQNRDKKLYYDQGNMGYDSYSYICDYGYPRYDKYNYIVKYQLKSGKTVYRKYLISFDNSLELLRKIYENKDYKTAHYPLYLHKKEDYYRVSVSYVSGINSYWGGGENYQYTELDYSENNREVEELIKAYKEDLIQLTLKETVNSYPIAILSFESPDGIFNDYYVYPSFDKTLAFLKELGFDTNRSCDLTKISAIWIEQYPKDYVSGMEPLINKEYKDFRDIAEIYPNLVDEQYYMDNPLLVDVEPYIRVDVFSKDEGNGRTCFFKSNQIPECVQRDLKH